MSGNDSADIWAWIHKDEERLRQQGGGKTAILDGWDGFWASFYHDYRRAELEICQAVEAARREGELRWELLLRHWRLQLWLKDDLTRALPEAIDLLDLATDDRLRDVPQRICAYHDVVDCYARMDAVGYRNDIVANSQNVLAQLPARHQCADCARGHLKTAAAAAGQADETEALIARYLANHTAPNGYLARDAVAGDYEALGKWDEAEQAYAMAIEGAKRTAPDTYLDALLGLARARAGKGNIEGAGEALGQARHTAKYIGGPYLLARQMEVEGYVAEAFGEPAIALEYLTRAARQYLDLARYRNAALIALRAAELAREKGLPAADGALTIAARAVGMMPPASHDVAARLEALGRQPIPPAAADTQPADDETGGGRAPSQSERAALEDALAAHVANGNPRGAAMALYRLGGWHAQHDAPRAAVDYFIANAVLEHLLQLSMNDREDALGALQRLSSTLPAGTVASALAAAEPGPPDMLAPLVGRVPIARWRWLVRCVAAEVDGKPVVEPEPDDAQGDHGFDAWIDHVASMTALLVRFPDQSDREARERWAAAIDETARDIERQVGPNGEGHEVLALARGQAALARGATPDEVASSVPPPFGEVIQRIGVIAQHPVWEHPGMWPLDFLVEDAAQRAVRALRLHDEHRATRLANLAFRFDLMTLDLLKQEQLQPIARFLEALSLLVHANGQRIPALEQPLSEPFDVMLAAVYEAGKSAVEEQAQ